MNSHVYLMPVELKSWSLEWSLMTGLIVHHVVFWKACNWKMKL